MKKLEKNHEISEDQLKDYLDEVQKLTDEHIKEIDEIMQNKEQEILKV